MIPLNQRAPLRKILELDEGYEVLECGHRLVVRWDMYGATVAYRRRCWKCAKNVPTEGSAV